MADEAAPMTRRATDGKGVFDPAATAREDVRCPLHPERQGRVFGRDHKGLMLRRGRACGTMFGSPRPPFEALANLEYRPEYYAREGTPGADAVKQDEPELRLLEGLGASGPLLDVGAGVLRRDVRQRCEP